MATQNTKTDPLEYTLNRLFRYIRGAAKQGKWDSEDIFISTGGLWRLRGKLNPNIFDTIRQLLIHLDEAEVEGTALGWPREKILSSLRSYERSDVVGIQLSWLISQKRRVSSIPDFETLIEAGAIIERFEAVDPYLQVVGPGVLSYYASWAVRSDKVVPGRECSMVVGEIERVLGLCGVPA